jgi:hypothetical protein
MAAIDCFVLLDLDGTIVGDVSQHVCEWELARTLRAQKERAPPDTKMLALALSNGGLLRPYFESFLKTMNALAIPVFVYTASERRWAEHLIASIETAVGARFERPLLSREHCLEERRIKSLAKVARVLFPRLRRSTRGIHTPDDVLERMVLVDNTPDILPRNERDRLVTCRTYSYLSHANVLRIVDEEVFHRNSRLICGVLARNGAISWSPTRGSVPSYVDVMRDYYSGFAASLKRSQEHNERERSHDRLFLRLEQAIATVATAGRRRSTGGTPSCVLQRAMQLAASLR